MEANSNWLLFNFPALIRCRPTFSQLDIEINLKGNDSFEPIICQTNIIIIMSDIKQRVGTGCTWANASDAALFTKQSHRQQGEVLFHCICYTAMRQQLLLKCNDCVAKLSCHYDIHLHVSPWRQQGNMTFYHLGQEVLISFSYFTKGYLFISVSFKQR